MNPFLRATVLLGIIAALCVGIDLQMTRAGQWLPPIPRRIAGWSSRDELLPAVTLDYMDHPKYVFRSYKVSADETVYANVIAVNGIESFHDPTVCAAGSGFRQVGMQKVLLTGPGTEARAMGFQNGTTRIVMVYWRQGIDGDIQSDPLPGWNDSPIQARSTPTTTCCSAIPRASPASTPPFRPTTPRVRAPATTSSPSPAPSLTPSAMTDDSSGASDTFYNADSPSSPVRMRMARSTG